MCGTYVTKLKKTMPVTLSISSNLNKQQIIHDRFNGKIYVGIFLAPFRTSKGRGKKEKQEEEEESEIRNSGDSSRNTANMLSDNETHCLMKQMACGSGF